MFAEKMNFKECRLYGRVGVAWGLAISGSECKKIIIIKKITPPGG